MSEVHDDEKAAAKGNGKDDEGLNEAPLDATSESAEPDEASAKSTTDGETEAPSIEEHFHALLKEKDELLAQKHDQLLRAQADYENYKKRVAREKDDLYKFGNERLMRELLPILDNFERSLAHAKEAGSLEGIVEGVDLIRKDMLNTLNKFGLREVAAQGEKFDPSMHEATAQVPSSDYPEGTVMEEFQKGYFIHDRLLRPAMVVVAGAPPETENSDGEEKE